MGEKNKGDAKRNYKDSVFRALFNNEENLRELYSAFAGREIDEPIEIVTLEDAIYNNIKNDLAFRVETKIIVMIEHQSTDSPNLPLRMLCYMAEEYKKLLDNRIYRDSLVKIPTPELYVFYNGKKNRKEEWVLKLSDAFAVKQKEIMAEVKVKVININYEKGAEILKKCRTLEGYSIFMYKIQCSMNEGMSLDDAVENAIRECIEEDIIADFLKKNGGKVMDLLRYVVTEEEKREMHMQEGLEQGLEQGREQGLKEGLKKAETKARIERADFIRNLKAGGVPIDKIVMASGLTRTEVEAI